MSTRRYLQLHCSALLCTILFSLLKNSKGMKCGGMECPSSHGACCDSRLYGTGVCCLQADRDWMIKLSGIAFGVVAGLISLMLLCSCIKKIACARADQNDRSVLPSNGNSDTGDSPPPYYDVIDQPSRNNPPCYFKLYPMPEMTGWAVASSTSDVVGSTNQAFDSEANSNFPPSTATDQSEAPSDGHRASSAGNTTGVTTTSNVTATTSA